MVAQAETISSGSRLASTSFRQHARVDLATRFGQERKSLMLPAVNRIKQGLIGLPHATDQRNEPTVH
jgi:hypothetical protein